MVELTDRATENIKYASHMSHDLGAVTIFRFSELGLARVRIGVGLELGLGLRLRLGFRLWLGISLGLGLGLRLGFWLGL